MAHPGPERRGAGTVCLSDAPLDTTTVVRALADAGRGQVGAVVTFTGVVRADAGTASPVTELAFEVFPEMAEAELQRIRDEAVARFRLAGLSIVHRTGRLRVGEEIVLVAAASRHRADAFQAAAWAMDEVKRRVPLWKRERRADGTEHWVETAHARASTP